MKKLLSAISVILFIVGISSSAYAYRYGASYAVMDLSSFDFSYNYVNGPEGTPEAQSLVANPNGAVGYYCLGAYSAGYAYAFAEKDADDGSFHGYSLHRWASATTPGANSGISGPVAVAEVGDGYDEDSGAVPGYLPDAIQKTYPEASQKTYMDYNRGAKPNTVGRGHSAAAGGEHSAAAGGGRSAMGPKKTSGTGGGNASGIGHNPPDTQSDGSLDNPQGGGAPDASIFPPDELIPDFTGIDTKEPESPPVPEPATVLLLGTGLIAMAGWGRNKFDKK